MRYFISAIFCMLFVVTASAGEVVVPAYKVDHAKKLKKREVPKVLRQYAQLPGANIAGPKGSFSVRKIVRNGHVQIIAIDTKGNSLNQVGASIIRQTDCDIRHGTLVEQIQIGFSRRGYAFHCL